jgi:carbonic anhydrase
VKAQTCGDGYDRTHDHFFRRAGPAQRGVRRDGGVRRPSFPTNDTLQVLGCVDSRVDPSDVLGLELGEGVVMRNIGGRITPATLRSWALLGRLGQGQPPRTGQPGDPAPHRLRHHPPHGLPRAARGFFEIPADELENKAVADPYAAVRVDTATARHTLPPSRLVSGLVYDVNTGLIEIVDPATQE